MVNSNLLSVPTLVESPFIILKVGEYTFGSYSKTHTSVGTKAQFPNYVKSLDVQKINGTVNTYTIVIEYQVSSHDNPNMMDEIFSSVSDTREISIQYGDWNSPSYIQREEKAIITSLTTQLDMSSSKIVYTIKCTGDAIGICAVPTDFPPRTARPSDVLFEMLSSSKYGLKSVFKGMSDISAVRQRGWISTTDKPVKLEVKKNITPIAYMNYLVRSMQPSNPSNNSVYMLAIREDYMNEYGGMWFEVVEIGTSSKVSPQNSTLTSSTDVYTIDINYPTDNLVTSFNITNDQSWAILNKFSEKVKQEEYIYRIDDDGKIVSELSPSRVRSLSTYSTSPLKQAWWDRMTEFPIEATLTIKGLMQAALIMSHVKLNVWFHGGQKHISSGLYVITKQQDTLNASGYKTTLTLLRIKGEDKG